MRQRSDLSVEGAATAEGLPVAPDMTEPRVPIERVFIDNASSCSELRHLWIEGEKGKQI
jgi:hypothetical protein